MTGFVTVSIRLLCRGAFDRLLFSNLILSILFHAVYNDCSANNNR
jgi:uncharacterized membrane protein YobD (UPF0266 family)